MILDLIIIVPLLVGILLFIVPKKAYFLKLGVALITSGYVLYQSIVLYFGTTAQEYLLQGIAGGNLASFLSLRADSLAVLISLLISFFTFLILIYLLAFERTKESVPNYSSYILLTLGASAGAALSDHLILFILFWSFLAITLFKLIPGKDEESSAAAVKSLVIIGGSDALMIVGIGIIWSLNGTLILSELQVPTTTVATIFAFLALLVGSFTKAGAFPFHSWVPDFTRNAPAPSSAYLPASLDKLLGIYFMARLCNEIFILNSWLTLILISLGVLTIIIAVMMALVQHNYRRLLGYHAVSQVGYMVTGLALGTGLGIIGGLFHMINNALYKSGLFLVAGNIKKQTGRDELDELGGLSARMPLTFISTVVFALAISGVPPFNGFASKWIIYQAIIDFGRVPGLANDLWIVWLSLAVMGSALTLASFIKFISGIFLGSERDDLKATKESPGLMLAPMLVLAILCIGLGVFATQYVVPFLFGPIVGEVALPGLWSSTLVSILIIVSILLGILVYGFGNIKKFRRAPSFIGGESSDPDTGFRVTDFYDTISGFKPLAFLYRKAEHGWFDLYQVSRNGVLKATDIFRKAHDGILQHYVIWILLGIIIMLILLI